MILAALLFIAQVRPPASAPGALNPHVTQANIRETICTPGWSRTVRPSQRWSSKYKRELLRRAHLPASASRMFEADHRVPLSIGGAPLDPRNIWLQPWERPGAHEKDQLELLVHRRVCNGSMTLEQGRAVFLGDWWAAYRRLVR